MSSVLIFDAVAQHGRAGLLLDLLATVASPRDRPLGCANRWRAPEVAVTAVVAGARSLRWRVRRRPTKGTT